MEAGPHHDTRQDRHQPHDDELGLMTDAVPPLPAGGDGTDDDTLSVPQDDDGVRGESPLHGDGLDQDLLSADAPEENDFRELRPPSKLRVWQLLPIVVIGALGSLMFAFPLAFEFGDGGPVVAMLGLLLSCCAAGWALMAARRVGHTWPGLPARGSGRRPDWRFVAAYAGCAVLLALLAVWRVARLR
jgi:hypothetical protein